jgi:prepilin-type N-terminal cleavage/methylation domain-containing protein
MRRAYSLIEIIFAIIIIGILASFALPTLMATKEDATSVVIKQESNELIKAITTFYYSQGDLQGQNSDVSLANMITLDKHWNLYSNSDGSANLAYVYNSQSDQSCLAIEVLDNYTIRLLIADATSLSDSSCEAVRLQFGITDSDVGSVAYDFINSNPNGANAQTFIVHIQQPLSAHGINW